jgi:hypothetical protein
MNAAALPPLLASSKGLLDQLSGAIDFVIIGQSHRVIGVIRGQNVFPLFGVCAPAVNRIERRF